ncbi:MAG: type II toxin-antitoxin system VapC family toxin [Desulfobulbaceae bacterium]|nr:type II toxin-antitoxin system VapC family toxin [Desulfobulbaceae bacterium]
MIFDTDIFIWVQRGNEKAARLMEGAEARCLSIQSYMELMQGAKNRQQHKYVKDFIAAFGFMVLPLSENIGHRALIYLEEYSLAAGMRAGDALIAATAVEHNLPLVTSNAKHFKTTKELQLKPFTP